MEECRTFGDGLYESNQLEQKDTDIVSYILEKNIREGRIDKKDTIL